MKYRLLQTSKSVLTSTVCLYKGMKRVYEYGNVVKIVLFALISAKLDGRDWSFPSRLKASMSGDGALRLGRARRGEDVR